jgi:hypothetical protein
LDAITDVTLLKVANVREWFKKVNRLKTLATSFSDDDAIAEIDRQMERMNLMYRMLTGKENEQTTKGELNLALLNVFIGALIMARIL